jgi:hypothetical protein
MGDFVYAMTEMNERRERMNTDERKAFDAAVESYFSPRNYRQAQQRVERFSDHQMSIYNSVLEGLKLSDIDVRDSRGAAA